MRTFEIIDQQGKSHYITAKSKADVLRFWVADKPKKIIERKDIPANENKITI